MENGEISREEKPLSPLICPHCNKSFKTVSCRNGHIRRTHKKEPPDSNKSKLLCPCPNCEYYYYRSDAVRQHISTIHKIELEMEVVTFPDNRAFFTWKGNIEEENKCFYISTGSPRYRGADKSRTMWFNCLAYTSCNDRPKENQQTVQEDEGRPFCPSTLKVTIANDDSFTVEFYKTHLGHKVLNDTAMPSEEKIETDGEISEAVSFNRILDEARMSVCGAELKRVRLLTQDDLHSKSAVFEQKNWGMLCGDEFNSVGVWVHQMKTLGEYSPVAFFKQKGKQHEKLDTDDFMIVIATKFQKEVSKKFVTNKICVDSIRGENSSDFSLTSVLALEESSLVFPVAFCISSKTDEVSMTVFFETVKTNIGTFDSPVFMSNDEPSFHVAWEKVMASNNQCPIRWLLCSWDIDSSWRKLLCEIEEEEEKIVTYKTLRVLLEESDIDVFQVSFESFLNELRDDVPTNRFSEDFYREYFHRAKMWAFCYRQELGISSDAHLEAMHQTLKNYYLDEETSKRVSKAIQGLLKLTQDEVLRMPSDFIDYDSNCWFYKMYEGHQQSLKISTIFQFNANNWSVQQPKSDKYSVVTKKGECTKDCSLKCSVCNVCVHSFCCTCDDNLILYNICQHIHACARLAESDPVAGEIANGEEMETSSENLQSTVSSDSNFNLKVKLKVIQSMLEYEYSEQALKQIEDTFDLVISFLVKNKQS